ncbi:receptor homology region, transmembrane domain- and RING domain-containing protein 3 [Ricinus communis]|uniref:receptor homology region, transmembrane domain- and RING domain-containing protein 3 n=1 Tax=Ricinus communis TaxID=3988 RepID=UPI00201A68C6|nr:receptor homology region, transmembrane domain- and RING domain-containing protein 3 [Ricinus communis]
MEDFLVYDVRIQSLTEMTVDLDPRRNQQQNLDGRFLTPRTIQVTFGFFDILRRYVQSVEGTYTQETVTPLDIVSDVEFSFIGSLLIDEEFAKRGAMEVLSRMGLPQDTRERIVREVGVEVRKLVSTAINSSDCGGGVSFSISVGIAAVKWEEVEYERYLEEVGNPEMESMEIEARLIPAAESSIRALKRMVFDDLENLRECTICMEQIEAGMEAIQMPCSHFYHPDCIVSWLRNGHFCPLCRYEMPVEQ